MTRAHGERMKLFRIVTMRGDLLVGLTEAALAGLGAGTEAERIARRIATGGQITAWHYEAGPGPKGGPPSSPAGRSPSRGRMR